MRLATIEGVLITARKWLWDGQPRVAEGLLRQALAVEPNHPDAEFLLGHALYAQGRSDEAWSSFERTLWLRPVTRWRLIQAAIAWLSAKTYLEIGVAEGHCLAQISAPVKLGVDPAPPSKIVEFELRAGRAAYFQKTSDAFFASPPQSLLSGGLDVAFVDGLHSYAQALADVENCLKHLKEDGVIFLHDCNPPSEAVATPASSAEEASAKNLPGWTGDWTGDVWKTIVHLRSCRPDLRVSVLDCDFGVGVVRRGTPERMLPYVPETIGKLAYRDLEANRQTLLDLRPPQDLLAILKSRA